MNWALSLDFIVWSVFNITILSSLYLIWCTGWGNILICPNSTIKKRKLEKIPLSEIGSISTLTAGSWDPQLSHPITWMLPVPLVSSIHALQPEDWAPDHWKYSFPKFTVFAFGLHLVCNFVWYYLQIWPVQWELILAIVPEMMHKRHMFKKHWSVLELRRQK